MALLSAGVVVVFLPQLPSSRLSSSLFFLSFSFSRLPPRGRASGWQARRKKTRISLSTGNYLVYSERPRIIAFGSLFARGSCSLDLYSRLFPRVLFFFSSLDISRPSGWLSPLSRVSSGACVTSFFLRCAPPLSAKASCQRCSLTFQLLHTLGSTR